MFDFEKLDVYVMVHDTNSKTLKFLFAHPNIDKEIREQWKRASLSVLLNLAEGTGRFSSADKKHFMTIARGSVFECVALLKVVHEMGWINKELYDELYSNYEQISKMLLGMFRSYGAIKNN